MTTTITVTINKQAQSKIEVNGVKGTSCTDLTKGLEKALGSVTSEEKTGEYYEQPVVQTVDQ